MFNVIKKLLIAFMMSLLIFTVVKAVDYRSSQAGDIYDNYEFIESAKLASSRYTTPDDLSIVDPAYYVGLTSHDDLIQENDTLQLYFNEDNISFKILNKDTGYVWSTAIEDAGDAGTYESILSSGIGIEYIQIEKDMAIQENIGIAETVFSVEKELTSNGIKLSLTFGGYCSTRLCTRMYDKYLEGDYTLEEMIEFGFSEINISFDFEVTLTETGIEAYIPYDSIVEQNPDQIVLSSIIVFPSMGATRMDEIPGYMVIPDGSGALIRYEDNQGQFNAAFEERFFGRNYGLDEMTQSVLNYELNMPIFGAVHGVNQNAFVGIIEEGMYNARLFAYPNGANNVPYNLIFPKYDIKQVYRQSFSSDGSGGAMKYLTTSTDNIKVRYDFLQDSEANYVGIAKDYRDYLTTAGELTPQTQSGDIELFLQYLMSDSENSFLGSSLVPMTTVDQIREMYDYFLDLGIQRQIVGFMGWNNGGYSGELPARLDFENRLGSNSSYRSLIDYINEDNTVLLLNNYIFASNDTNGISYRNDVAKGSNRFKMEFTCDTCVHTDTYVLYPHITKQLALNAYDDYVSENVQVLFESMANLLISYYDSGYYNREDAIANYLEVMQLYQGMASYMYPYSYAFAYTNAFYNTPLYNSQLKYYDDVVPLLQIVLKGSVDMYASYLNYNSLGKETLLNLIDFGINPAYVLTYEPSSRLKETDLGRYYTTQFDLWKETIGTEYTYVNDALKHVNGVAFESRTVLDYGIVKVSYENGIDIYINYTTSDYTDGTIIVPAMDYLIGGVSS
ncbi:MAG: hypothetical protein JXB08_02855 [Bacilli bacterium]|nr:hypothetical protein [Bacilli bacterium]MBN2877860.1 hypothetical protein [Bacilli bacterium]